MTPEEWTAVRLSLLVASTATLTSLPFGIAIAWLLARARFWGKGVLDTLVHLPLIMPPVVTGYLLLISFGRKAPIGAFLEKNPSGGMHHVCYEVDDILAARDQLKAGGARVLGDGNPKTGAHGKPVLFLHPKDFFGTLIELEQA